MKVIVTGGSGRIGRAVLKTLVDRGHEVLNLDRRPSDRPGRFVYMDLRRRELLQPVMEQAEALIHMGEIPHAGSGHYTDEEVFGHNCAVGSLVFQLASELKYKRVLYTSTIQIYGFVDAGAVPPAMLPADETHPLRPQNAYALGKVAVEAYAHYCARKYGLSVAAFRLPWVLGEQFNEHWYQWTENEKKLDPDMGIYVRDTDVAECFALAWSGGRRASRPTTSRPGNWRRAADPGGHRAGLPPLPAVARRLGQVRHGVPVRQGTRTLRLGTEVELSRPVPREVRPRPVPRRWSSYSHSIVAGGLVLMS